MIKYINRHTTNEYKHLNDTSFIKIDKTTSAGYLLIKNVIINKPSTTEQVIRLIKLLTLNPNTGLNFANRPVLQYVDTITDTSEAITSP